jgi:transcriptional regulator with XRE-family HTH domain
VAQLAGMSVDYYVRLEQGRGPHPSRQVLSALARALMLTADERDYLFRVAGESPPPVAGPSREITPGIRHLLDSMPDTPAYVVDAAYNVLVWNQLATHFIGDLSGYEDRNMIRWTFRRGPADVIWSDEHFLAFTRATVADLRAGLSADRVHVGHRAHLVDHMAGGVVPRQYVSGHPRADLRGRRRESKQPQAASRPGGEGLRAVLPAVGQPQHDTRHVLVGVAEELHEEPPGRAVGGGHKHGRGPAGSRDGPLPIVR